MLLDFLNATHSLGITIEKFSTKELLSNETQAVLLNVADVAIEKGILSISSLRKIQIATDRDLPPELETNLICTAVSGMDVLIRSIDLPVKKEKEIDDVVAFQAEPLFPIPLDEIQFDWSKRSKLEPGAIIVQAVSKKALEEHISKFEDLNIEAEWVTTEPAALAAFCNHFITSHSQFIAGFLNHNHAVFVVLQEGYLIAAQTIPLDSGPLNSRFGDSKNTESIKNDCLRVLFSLMKYFKNDSKPGLFICGPLANNQEIRASFQNNASFEFITANAEATGFLEDEINDFVMSIGAAFSQLETQKAKTQVNFRKGDFLPKDPWKRLKMPLATYFGLSILAALSLYVFGTTLIDRKETELKSNYVQMLAGMNKSLISTEEAFRRQYPGKFSQDEDLTLETIDFTREDIADRLRFVQNQLKLSPNLFPLYANLPRVSDVLAWLTHHSVVTQAESEKAPITLEHFSYVITKRPELNKASERYQAKVELEFSSPLPKAAREFHDALITSNAFVDPKAEVKWSANRGKYKTSFMLKDRTAYLNSSNSEVGKEG